MNTEYEGAWSSGLYDCFSDLPSCCLVTWCSCVAFGRMAEILDEGNTTCCAAGTVFYFNTLNSFQLGSYRTKLRQQFMLEESPCSDNLLYVFCGTCALCQQYRELQSRGFDMSIGWKGNMERRNGGVEMEQSAPRLESGMKR